VKKIIAVRGIGGASVHAELRALTALYGCRHIVRWSEDVAVDAFGDVHLHMKYYALGDLDNAIAKCDQAG
jgi:hypothetical protein